MSTKNPSIAFYYSNNIPVNALSQFSQIVVDPGEVSETEILKLKQYGAKVLAYVSVGESERWRKDYELIDKSHFIGVNEGWESDIMDLTKSDWHRYLMQYRFTALSKKHYDGFFLDTLDSYQAVVDESKWSEQEQGLVKIIKKISNEFPQSIIILNRGFPILKKVHSIVHGVIAESLYANWDPIEKKYGYVKADDRKWLLNNLNIANKKYNLPVTVIDYLPPSKRKEARKIAKKITQLGFTPWISTPELDYLGIGRIEVIPRKILMLYNSNNQYLGDMFSASIHSAAAMPLEYMGYVPIYYDIKNKLPEEIIQGRYAGIVAWFDGQVGNANYRDWIVRQLDDGVKIAFMGGFSFDADAEFLQKLGLKSIDEKIQRLNAIQYSDDFVGFESKPMLSKDLGEIFQSKSKNNSVHLQITFDDNPKNVFDPVITGEWGGLAFSPWIRDSQMKGVKYWILDPFKFFKKALDFPDIPMPDVTTENGRRLWMAHIDGDGFLNRAEMLGTPYSAEVIRDRILKVYAHYPHTVSIIEGEIGSLGLYPKKSSQLEDIARDIFKLSNVEAASHTFSHPFKWLEIRENQKSGDGYNLAIENYSFSFEREIKGSIEYMNKYLMPKDKKTKIILWTGSALPTELALRYSDSNGYVNMNGGGTTIRKDRASLMFVSPMARVVGEYVQVYAPIMNENVYTNNWTGPFYGFQRVIETFKMTNEPRRLKAIDIYYHFYSGSKPASLKALKKAYQWSLKQDIFPVYVGDYSPKIIEFREVVIAKDLNDYLYYSGMNRIRTLRSFLNNKWPDLVASQNIVGYRTLHDATYLSVGSEKHTVLKMLRNKSTGLYLVQTNGRVNQWQVRNKSVVLSLKSHLPLMIEVASNYKQCKILKVKNDQKKTLLGWKFNLAVKEVVNVRIQCK